MKTAGRPTKYNEETHTKICEALKAGNTRRDSYVYAGVSGDTFARWLEIYPEFAEDVAKSEAIVTLRNVGLIQKAAQNGTWQAAAWWLERKHKAEWSSRVEQTGADGSPVKVIVEYADKPNG
jgi:hypothetical protein